MWLDIDLSRFAGAFLATLVVKAIEMLRASPIRPPKRTESKPRQPARQRKRSSRESPPL